MNSHNSRTVHNKLASQLLYRLLDWREWSELKLAEESGILPGVVSAHLSGQRPIRPQHLAAYLRVLERQERSALLDAWLQDNADCVVIANLLDGTRTDSMPSFEENRSRMLDWWATAITRDSRIAKIFRRFRTKAPFKFPLEILSPVSATAVQFQAWLLEQASSLLIRVKHATVALVTLVLALCQQGKVTQQAGELAEQEGELAEKALANSLLATLAVPALAETTNFNFDLSDPSLLEDRRESKIASRAIVKGGPSRAQPKYQVAPALRIRRAIDHEWHRLVRAHKSVHGAITRLTGDTHPRRFKQTYRKQRTN